MSPPTPPLLQILDCELQVFAPRRGAPNRDVCPALGSAERLSCASENHSEFLTLGLLLPCDMWPPGGLSLRVKTQILKCPLKTMRHYRIAARDFSQQLLI